MIIEDSTRKGKRYTAVFPDGHRVSFGSASGKTYIDHHDPKKRKNYIARHSVNEEWTDKRKASTLSRYLLWGDHKTLTQNLKAYNKMFPPTAKDKADRAQNMKKAREVAKFLKELRENP